MLWKKRYKPTSEKELKDKWNHLPLESGDIKAMVLAALITLLPAVLFVGAIFAVILWILFL